METLIVIILGASSTYNMFDLVYRTALAGMAHHRMRPRVCHITVQNIAETPRVPATSVQNIAETSRVPATHGAHQDYGGCTVKGLWGQEQGAWCTSRHGEDHRIDRDLFYGGGPNTVSPIKELEALSMYEAI